MLRVSHMPLASQFRNARLALLQRALQATARVANQMGRATTLPQRHLTGIRGEDEALFYLRRTGFVVVAQQWKSAMYPGDIDLLAWDGDCLCVIEVKTRTRRDEMFTAEGAVDQQKRRALRRLANAYVRRLPRAPATKRMDVLAVYMEQEKPPEFHHIRAAFPWDDR